MGFNVTALKDIDKADHHMVGGKGANLGELFRIHGIKVPDGFCISAEVFMKVIDKTPQISKMIDQLSHLKVEDRKEISELSFQIRKEIEDIVISEDIQKEIKDLLWKYGEKNSFAVRSSATAEDLPTASFAGQQDTYLNIIGAESIFKHISMCWASLYTDRAVAYRIQNGFDHSKVYLSVVIQKMVFPQVSGILFTADPVTGNRNVSSIDASFGLGEALVSGIVNPDIYKVQSGRITDKKISSKKLAVYALEEGGTIKQEIKLELQNNPALTDKQILELEQIGRKIEKHFEVPQDIEWCLADGDFYIVQSRPITTLYPIPESDDKGNHVYLSVGHNQMMTDAMKPLGLSFFQHAAAGPMVKAGGRLFVDVTAMLASPKSRQMLLTIFGAGDPLTKDALMTLIDRDYIKLAESDEKEVPSTKSTKGLPNWGAPIEIENDPDLVREVIQKSERSLEVLKQSIRPLAGTELLDFILEDIKELKTVRSDPKGADMYMAAINASTWINENMEKWLGEKNAADTISQSVSNNITSEMGLALLDVADVIRPYHEILDYLKNNRSDDFMEALVKLKGGEKVKDAISAFLDKYGMRCVGEIDITKTRWSENPSALIPLILSNIKNFEPGASKVKFEQGLKEALEKEHDLLERLIQLPDGEDKAKETKRMIDIVRTFIGYREYPKYGMICRYFEYKTAIMKEADKLMKSGVINEKEDIYYLTFEELRDVLSANKVDNRIIRERKEEFRSFEKLSPPRVMTSDGEIIPGRYSINNIPADALPGIPASSGIIEGRARLILKMEDADLEEGDILVTTFTDPSWTPLFVSLKGLVTEIGGLMTHGAVIAREYGLPAVVGVENVTKLVKDGDRIRVNGAEGYVVIL